MWGGSRSRHYPLERPRPVSFQVSLLSSLPRAHILISPPFSSYHFSLATATLSLTPTLLWGIILTSHTFLLVLWPMTQLQVMSPIFSFEDKFSLPSADFEKFYFYSGQLMDRRSQANNNELPVYLAKSFCNYYVYSPREAIA